MAQVRRAVLSEHQDIGRCVIASRDPKRAGRLVGGADVVDLAEVGPLQPDLVFVTSATARHYEDVQHALRWGCPVLCEKPLADSAEQARQLAAMASAAEAPLYVAFQRHFEPAMNQLHGQIVDGSLGVLYHLRFTHFDRRPSQRDFIAGSGGIFKDLLVHDVECALWLANRAVHSVFATGAVRKWENYAEFGDLDTASALLTLDDGLTVTLNGARHNAFGQDARVEAIGSAGSAAAGLTQATPITCIEAPGLLNHDPPQSFQERFALAYLRETTAFVEFALGKADRFGGTSATAAAQAIGVAEACECSLEAKQAVRLG